MSAHRRRLPLQTSCDGRTRALAKWRAQVASVSARLLSRLDSVFECGHAPSRHLVAVDPGAFRVRLRAAGSGGGRRCPVRPSCCPSTRQMLREMPHHCPARPRPLSDTLTRSPLHPPPRTGNQWPFERGTSKASSCLREKAQKTRSLHRLPRQCRAVSPRRNRTQLPRSLLARVQASGHV